MKELTSKKTKRVQMVTDEDYRAIVARGWGNRFKVRDVKPKAIKDIPPEIIKSKTKKKND